jgi:hypothetical protein
LGWEQREFILAAAKKKKKKTGMGLAAKQKKIETVLRQQEPLSVRYERRMPPHLQSVCSMLPYSAALNTHDRVRKFQGSTMDTAYLCIIFLVTLRMVYCDKDPTY